MSFDWQTEEDNDWNEQAWQETPVTAVSRKPPWLTIVLVAIMISVAGAIVFRQVNRRLEVATSSAESDIFAAHNLISRAAASRDAALGRAVLSGRDVGWSRAQSEMMLSGLLYEHPGLGLLLPEGEAAFAPLSGEDERLLALELDPDLSGAELLYVRDYVAMTEEGYRQITLQQTAVYRRGETRWLLSPPEEPFWGEWQTVEMDNLTIIYPERDDELMQELAPDLQSLLTEACSALPELTCSAQTAVQLRFDTHPESLLEVAEPANLYDNNLRLNLPTPTLVGLPIDQDGYEALLLGYGANLLSAIIGQGVAYECCQHAPIFQAIMTYQLSELGLATWPVTQEVQKALADGGVHTDMMFPYWSSQDFHILNGEDSWELFGFVDFLLKQYATEQTPYAMLMQLGQSNAYQSWLENLSTVSIDNPFGDGRGSISRDWWFYAMTQAETTVVSEQPYPLPAQDLQVSCVSNRESGSSGQTQTSLYRYVLNSESWLEEIAYPGLAFFNPLPQDDGVILQLMEVSEQQLWQTLLWRDGIGVDMMGGEDSFSISLGQMDPNGRFLLTFAGDDIDADEGLPGQMRLIDVASCLDDACGSTALEGTPYWSPNGQNMLLSETSLFESAQYPVDGRLISLNPGGLDQAAAIWLSSRPADKEDATEVGKGLSPFWITNELFGYIRPASADGFLTFQELVVLSTDTLESEVLMKTSVLQTLLPEKNLRSPLIMRYAMAHPTDTNRILLMVSTATEAQDGYLFQIDRQSQEADLLFAVDFFRGEHSLGFSPDGRFLVATGAWWHETDIRNGPSPFGALLLYDFETGEQQTIINNNNNLFPAFTFDWSQDGNWLAFVRDSNVISLVAPGNNYQQMIIHDVGNCTSLAWINPLRSD